MPNRRRKGGRLSDAYIVVGLAAAVGTYVALPYVASALEANLLATGVPHVQLAKTLFVEQGLAFIGSRIVLRSIITAEMTMYLAARYPVL
jgi:hypothetical protein